MFVYLSGPITARGDYTVRRNADAAIAVYLDLMARGVDCFCPHLAALVPAAFDVPYERWMAHDFALIDRSTHVLMLPRWETSSGAVRERDYGIQKGKTITSHAALVAQLGLKTAQEAK